MALRLPSPVHAGQFPSLAGGEYRESPALASAVSAIAQRKRQGRRQAAEMQYQQNAFDQQDKMQKAKTLEQTVNKAKQDKAWGLVGGVTEDINRGDDISARDKLRELDEVDPKLGAQLREDIAVKRKFNDKQLQEIAKKKEESMLATYDTDLRTWQRKVGKGTAEYLQWIDDNTQVDDPTNSTRGPGSSRGMFTQEQAKVLKSKAWDAMTAATSPNNKTAMMAHEMAKPKDMKKWEETQRKKERENRAEERSEEYLSIARKNAQKKDGKKTEKDLKTIEKNRLSALDKLTKLSDAEGDPASELMGTISISPEHQAQKNALVDSIRQWNKELGQDEYAGIEYVKPADSAAGGEGKELPPDVAAQIFKEVGGDWEKATQRAIDLGYKVDE